jgi:hypothetical protein
MHEETARIVIPGVKSQPDGKLTLGIGLFLDLLQRVDLPWTAGACGTTRLIVGGLRSVAVCRHVG